MAGELSERVVRRAARAAARQTALINNMNKRFGDPLGSAQREREFELLRQRYDSLPSNIRDQRWAPFVNEAGSVTSDIIAQMTQGQTPGSPGGS